MATNPPFDAVLFDLDGVLTSTAALHARCWKLVFADVLDKVRGQTIEVDISHEETTYRLLEGRGLLIVHGDEQLRLTPDAPLSRHAAVPDELEQAA